MRRTLRCDDCTSGRPVSKALSPLLHQAETARRAERPVVRFAGYRQRGRQQSSATRMHVCYSQNFFARKRGAPRSSATGTLELTAYTDELVVMHHQPRIETYRTTASPARGWGHGAADKLPGIMRGAEWSRRWRAPPRADVPEGRAVRTTPEYRVPRLRTSSAPPRQRKEVATSESAWSIRDKNDAQSAPRPQGEGRGFADVEGSSRDAAWLVPAARACSIMLENADIDADICTPTYCTKST